MTAERDWFAGVGECLRGNRELRGWTLYDVAALLGCSANAVSRYERGLRRMNAYQFTVLRREGLVP